MSKPNLHIAGHLRDHHPIPPFPVALWVAAALCFVLEAGAVNLAEPNWEPVHPSSVPVIVDNKKRQMISEE